MDFDSFTEAQCRDWLAENAGWLKPRTNPLASLNMEWTHNSNEHGTIPFGWDESADVAEHPIPATLDQASRLKDGWKMDSIEWYPSTVEAKAINADDKVVLGEADLTGDYVIADQRLACFRLQCKVEAMNNTERKEDAC